MLALVDCRTGKFDEARASLDELLDRFKDEPITRHASGSSVPSWRTTGATTTWRPPSTRGPWPGATTRLDLQLDYQPDQTPGQASTSATGRKEDARRVLVEFAKPREIESGYPDDYVAQMRLQGLTSAARQLVDLGYAAEAVPMLSESTGLAESIGPDAPELHRQPRRSRPAGPRGPDPALEGLRRRDAALDRRRLSDRARRRARPRRKETASAPPAEDQAVDLVVPRPSPRARQVGRQEPLRGVGRGLSPDSPKVAKRRGGARRRRASTPDDFSSRSPRPWPRWPAATATGSRRASTASTHVVGGRRSNPSPRRPGQRPPAGRGGRRLPLWLVARACWGDESTRELGERFAARAAGGQPPPGRQPLDDGHAPRAGPARARPGRRARADAAWGRMLDLILAREPAAVPRPPSRPRRRRRRPAPAHGPRRPRRRSNALRTRRRRPAPAPAPVPARPRLPHRPPRMCRS